MNTIANIQDTAKRANELTVTIQRMEERLLDIELHPIAMDNQYREIEKLKRELTLLQRQLDTTE